MREGQMAVTSRVSRRRASLVASAMAFILVSSLLVSPYGILERSSAESLPSHERLFYLHEGGPSGSLDYDWLNSSDPDYMGSPDYDGDGNIGITIKKYTPADRWRHFWVLWPAVNADVHVQGDLTSHIWAASRDNESGTEMIVQLSDMDPADWLDPTLWPLIASETVTLTGPVYSSFKPYDLVSSGVDYVLAAGHHLVMTIMQGDSLKNDGVLVMYDDLFWDSYVSFDALDFISLDELLVSGTSGEPRTMFSDSEDVILRANISNPFGAYEIVGALVNVSYSSNGTTVVPPTFMTLVEEDNSAFNSWKLFSHTLQSLPADNLTITVYAVDPQGAPSWLYESIKIVSVDHFGLSAPTAVTVNDTFSLTVAALDESGAVIPEWMGTLDLEAYLVDMVSPASGSLGVITATISSSDLGQIVISNQTYDYSEETIVIRAVSGSHYGWSEPINVRSGPVVSIVVTPPGPLDLGAGTTQEFSVTGWDVFGHLNTTWTPNWSLLGALGDLQVDGFSASLDAVNAGSGFVNCSDPATGVTASVAITVDPSLLSSIVTVPSGSLTIREGVAQALTAVGYDMYGNEVPIDGAVWSTNTSGSIIGGGSSVLYIAGYIPEVGSIDVSVGNVRASISVMVTAALDGPSWLNAIPVQIASEDSNWTLDLDSYWQHANGTDYLSWFAEGVNTSLYIVIHEPTSSSYMKFLTQPDKWGEDVFRLWIRDENGFSNYQDITVSVQAVNDRPTFVNNPPTELYVKFDTPYSFDYAYYVKDVDTSKSQLRMTSSLQGSIYFNRLIGTFLFPEKDGSNAYFEVATLTVTDAAEGASYDSTNSDSMKIIVRVTDDNPPSLNQSLPDVTLMEGDVERWVFDLDDYFYDLDNEYLVYYRDFQNIDVRIDNVTHDVYLSALSEWSGVTEGTFTALDPVGALKTDTIKVTVIPVNDPPSIRNPGTVHVKYDTPYYMDATMYVTDPDHSFDELEFVFDTSYAVYSPRDFVFTFPASESGGPYTESYIVPVKLTVTDPDGDSMSCSFEVVVSDNLPPEVRSPNPYYDYISFLEDGFLNNTIRLDALFVDYDDGEQYLNYSVEGNSNVHVVIYPNSAVNFSAAVNWSGTEAIEFRAIDEHGGWASWQMTVTVIPVNDAPVVIPLPNFYLKSGESSRSFDISGHFYDSETPYSGLRIVASPESMVFVVGKLLYVTLTEDTPEVTVTIFAVDSDGAESNIVTFTVRVLKDWAETIGYPYTFPLVLMAAGIGAYLLARRIPRPFALQDLFLIHNDGRLISHVSKQESTSIDKDVVSAMFTAVQEFVRDSFQAGEVGLKKLEIGERNVMIEKGSSVYLALIYSGWPPKTVFDALRMLLSDAEERFKGRIERWNGTKKALKGVDQMLQDYMIRRYEPGAWLPEEEGIGEEEWVDIISKDN